MSETEWVYVEGNALRTGTAGGEPVLDLRVARRLPGPDAWFSVSVDNALDRDHREYAAGATFQRRVRAGVAVGF